MTHPSEKTPEELAMRHMQNCAQSVVGLRDLLQRVLDDIMIASDLPGRREILNAWSDGMRCVADEIVLVRAVTREIIRFMDTPEYEGLPSKKRVDYWEVVASASRDIERIESQKEFYFLLSIIEHTEQTIGFLWQQFKNKRDKVLYRELNGTLASRGLAIHKRQLQKIRERLRYDIGNIIQRITDVIKHLGFSGLDDSKQREYRNKLTAYREQLGEIDL